jgi:hypothetical protein
MNIPTQSFMLSMSKAMEAYREFMPRKTNEKL